MLSFTLLEQHNMEVPPSVFCAVHMRSIPLVILFLEARGNTPLLWMCFFLSHISVLWQTSKATVWRQYSQSDAVFTLDSSQFSRDLTSSTLPERCCFFFS